MTLLTRKSHDEAMLEGLLSMKTEDLQLVMEDGVLKTSKFLLMNIFPQLSEYVPGYIISYHNISIHLPDHTMHTVREALVKMVTIGDTADLAVVLGFGIAEQTDVGDKFEDVSSEYIERIDVKPIKEELIYDVPIYKEVPSLSEKKICDFKCILCGIAFRSQSAVTIHMVGAHEKTGNFKCAQCGVVFETHSNLTKHLQEAHGIKRPINCKKCDMYFDGNQSYRKHTKNCSYKCLQCSKTFETQLNRDRYIPRAHHKKVSVFISVIDVNIYIKPKPLLLCLFL